MRKPPSPGSPVKLTFLGTGDAFASGGRFQAGYLIESRDCRVLLEAGPSILCAMKRYGVAPSQLDYICISHLHGDHFGGLPFLFLEYLWERPPRKPIVIAGPRHLEERAWRLFRTMFPFTSGDVARLRRQLKFVVLEPGAHKQFGRLRLAAIRTPHMRRDASLALRLALDGKVIAFSGDSGWTDELVPFTAGADLFLCECTYFESAHLDFHMNYPRLEKQRPRFKVKRMILTHVGREVLAHPDEIRIETATDGMEVRA
ncbi:MAG: MBL fold metallo-hydrolase [Candidatus Binataceae bacterium]